MITDIHSSTADALTQILQEVLDKLGAKLPKGVDTKLPAVKAISLPWDMDRLKIQYQNLPLQDAVDLISFLVLMQSARAKFEFGVATVGGRTHIGVMTKDKGFTMLNEPELKHRNIGFADDL